VTGSTPAAKAKASATKKATAKKATTTKKVLRVVYFYNVEMLRLCIDDDNCCCSSEATVKAGIQACVEIRVQAGIEEGLDEECWRAGYLYLNSIMYM